MSEEMPEAYDGPLLTKNHLIKNYDEVKAYRDVSEVMRKYAAQLDGDVDVLRAELESQLTELTGLAMSKARDGDLYGVQVALQGIQTKSKLLGLNKPEIRRLEGKDGGSISIEILRAAQERANEEDID
jgi:hypothetical protein